MLSRYVLCSVLLPGDTDEGHKMAGLRQKQCVFGFTGLIFGLFAILPVQASTHPAFDQTQKREIERIVTDLIQQRPELVLEALRRLQDRRREAVGDRQQRILVTRRDDLLYDPGSPIGGNPNGSTDVVEFFDYNCPYCKVVMPRIEQLLKDDPSIRFVYKEWPVLGPGSVMAARIALAAGKQGKYQKYHRELMQVRGRVSEDLALDVARRIGLDMEKLILDMESEEIDEILERNSRLASLLGFSGTPGFVVGEQIVPGAADLKHLKHLVAEAKRSQ